MCSSRVAEALGRQSFNRDDLRLLLAATEPADAELIRSHAYDIKVREVGARVYLRGLIEFSNECRKNCFYCGIRRANDAVLRFTMPFKEIIDAAMWAHENRYASVVLQAGEQNGAEYVAFVERVVREIRDRSNGELGITLSLGEQSLDTYRRWFDAGAHRYLLRVETTNQELYARLHPSSHRFDARLRCIDHLREAGYQVGTGVMIGLPEQTIDDLVDDLLFFRDRDIDMIGMGPYVVHQTTPLGRTAPNDDDSRSRRLELALRMISVARIMLRDVNIAASTALQALDLRGRDLALRAGANIVMPAVTATEYRKNYFLYDGKPFVDDSAGTCRESLEARVDEAGETIGYGEWGDSPHARKRSTTSSP